MNTDVETLARTLYGEAKARDVEDATSIAAVVMNRVTYPNWPSDVSAVCLQPYQFSCWNVSDPNRQRIMGAKVTETWFRQCHGIAERAVARQIADPTAGATHYHAHSVKKAPTWAKGKTPCHLTAGHVFFNDIDTKPPAGAKEALDQNRPLSSTRTVRGGQAAAVGTAGTSVLVGMAETIDQAKDSVGGLMLHVDQLRWVFIGLTVLGIGIMLYARWQDREKGKR